MTTAAPGFIAYLRQPDGQETTTHRGYASLEHRTLIHPSTSFNVGSVAKQITAHLLLHTMREQHISPDTPAAKFLPQLAIADITLADLITHHSGLRDAETLLSLVGYRDHDHYCSNDLIQLAHRQQQRAVAPGTFLYSNTNYLLITRILENLHTASLQQIGQQLVFDPAGMHTAQFKTDLDDVLLFAASSYRHTGQAGWRHAARPATLPGPGSLWCSVTDLSAWLSHLHQRWHDPAGYPDADLLAYQSSDDVRYSYGPGLYRIATPAAVYHHGHEHGFSASVYLKHDGQQIICLSNAEPIRADQVTSHILSTGSIPDSTAAMPTFNNPQQSEHDCLPDSCKPPTVIGTYQCSDVPGVLKLGRRDSALILMRRGTADHLQPTASPARYQGDGYQVDLRHDSPDAQPTGFTLTLPRAPGLQYWLTSPAAQEVTP